MKAKAFCIVLLLVFLSATAMAADKYRAVYIGHMVEYGEVTGDVNEDLLIYNSVRWVSMMDPLLTVKVSVLHSLGTDAYWYSVMWDVFDLRYPDITVVPHTTRPITYADLVLEAADVLVISDAWHGPPDQCPPPSPGLDSWAYSDQEIADISQYVQEGHGILITAGSFGQFARDTVLDYNNYRLAPLMCVVSTGGGDPLNADAFPWSRDTAPYPATRAFTDVVIDDPLHPIVQGLPASYLAAYGVATSQWMALDGASQVAHYTDGVTQFTDSLITACAVSAAGDEDEDSDEGKDKGKD
jgi:hypothetical protein